MKRSMVILLSILFTLSATAEEQGAVVTIEDEKQFTAITANKDKLVIVDFFAIWCPSCSVVMNSLKEVQLKMSDKTILTKVDFGEQQKLAQKFGVQSVPTVLFFKNGKRLYKLENLCTTKDYQAVISGLVKNGVVPDDFIPEGHTKALGISANQAKDLIDKSGAVVLDVRSNYEYNRGHLENAIHIPVNSIEARAGELAEHKAKNIVVYCLSGYRSAIACDILSKRGYKVFNMARGIGDWQRSGFELVP